MGDHQADQTVRVGCAFTHRAEIDTPAVFQVQPRDGRDVRVLDEHRSIHPAAAARHYHDLNGNPCLRVTPPADRPSLHYDINLGTAYCGELVAIT